MGYTLLDDDAPTPARAPATKGRYTLLDDDAPAPPAPKRVGTVDRVRAAAAGINRGFFSDLAGLPVDTAANLVDLAKAAVGFTYNEGKQLVTGKRSAPPEWTEPYDRTRVPGTSAWIEAQLNAGGLGAAINNPNPQDAASRILHTGGRFAGASVVPTAAVGGKAQLANVGMGAVSGLTSGSVAEVAPEWAGLAGMIPSAAATAGPAGVRRAVRGGEAGRRKMEQRIQDLKEGGIDAPSVGLASGNHLVMGLENLLSHTPGSVGLYKGAKEGNLAGMKAKTDVLRDALSAEFGPVVAGEAIQAALKDGFRNRVNSTTRKLNDQVADRVGPSFYTFPENALDVARGMSAINPAAPATSAALRNNRIAGIADDLGRDVMGTPIPGDPLMNAPTRYQRADGQVMDAPPGIPFQTLKNLRTSIGEEANSSAILGTPEGAQFKRLYGAMSQDMRQAVGAADRQRAGIDVGPLPPEQLQASMGLDRANKFYSRASTRAEDLDGIANRSTPEGAYGAVANSLNSGPTLYSKLRGAVDPATRQKLAATIIDEMGAAKPGQQTADGEAWSPQTFLTNYAKLNQNGGGKELFKRMPGGEKHANDLAKIAKAAEMLGDASKIWSNPSGTNAAYVATGTFGAIGGGLFFAPFAAGKAAAGLLAVNQASKRLLLNPRFTHWLAQAPKQRSQAQTQSHLQRLTANAQMWKDEQLKQDVQAYVEALQEEPAED